MYQKNLIKNLTASEKMAKNKQIYLAGAMEAAPDKGARWRTILTPQLEKLGYKAFNPCKETDGAILEQYGWAKLDYEKIKTPKYRKQYLEIFRKIVLADLEAVLSSDMLIVYFNKYMWQGSAGTHGEITVARRNNIPVYIVLAGDMDFEDIPAWVVGCTTSVFDSFKEFLDFLKE